jgi:hypothetical protein
MKRECWALVTAFGLNEIVPRQETREGTIKKWLESINYTESQKLTFNVKALFKLIVKEAQTSVS